MKIKTARFILFLAALYNLIWGGLISLFPGMIFYGGENPSLFSLIIIQCVGMLVGVYGIGYYIASLNPIKYWPLILVGLIGKVLGPIGAVYYILTEGLSPDFLIVNFFNDFIWMIPFTMILVAVHKGTLVTKRYTEDNNKSLYEQILGSQFDLLAPKLKGFHSSKTPSKMTGHFKVERGETWLTNLIGNLAGLPKATDSVDVELNVRSDNNKEYWQRRIGTVKSASVQWQSDNYMVEKFGAFKVNFGVEVTNGELIVYDLYSTLLGIPLPSFFTPQIYTCGRDTKDGIYTYVDICFYPFGKIIRYYGIVKVVEPK